MKLFCASVFWASMTLVAAAIGDPSLAQPHRSQIKPPAAGSVDVVLVCDGATDNRPAIQRALDGLAGRGGTVRLRPSGAGACLTSAGISPPSNTGAGITVVQRLTLSPYAQPATPTAVYKSSSDNFMIDCQGAGGFNGLSSKYFRWLGFDAQANPDSASGPNFLQQNHINNCRFELVGVPPDGSSSYDLVRFFGVENSGADGNTFVKSGYYPYNDNRSERISAFGGSYLTMIDVIASRKVAFRNNRASNVGGAPFMSSCNFDEVWQDNSVQNSSYFGFKAGFCAPIQIDSASGTSSVFTVTGPHVKKMFVPGKAFDIIRAGGDVGIARVKTVDNVSATTVRVHLDAPASHIIWSDSQVEALPTKVVYDGNTVDWTADNGFDINGWADISITHTKCQHGGMLTLGGASPGTPASCIWLGYDNQPASGFTGPLSSNARVDANQLSDSAGPGITVAAGPTGVHIGANTVSRAALHSASGSADAGIYLQGAEHGARDARDVRDCTVSNNTIASDLLYGITLNWGSLCRITGNHIRAPQGLFIGANSAPGSSSIVIDGNDITITSTAKDAAAIRLYAGAGDVLSGVTIRGTVIRSATMHGEGFGVMTTGPGAFSGVSVAPSVTCRVANLRHFRCASVVNRPAISLGGRFVR